METQTQKRVIVWRRDPVYLWSVERRQADAPAFVGQDRRRAASVIGQADADEAEAVEAAAT